MTLTRRILDVPIGDIYPNPFRDDCLPYSEAKIEELTDSFRQAGVWESMIGRDRKAGGVEIPFAHHRLETARRLGLKSLPIVIRTISDDEMLLFMGKENSESYNADIANHIVTWDSAAEYLHRKTGKLEGIDIAKALGWTDAWTRRREPHRKGEFKELQMTHLARACLNAHKLIAGGYCTLADFRGASLTATRYVTERAVKAMQIIDKAPQKNAVRMKQRLGQVVPELLKDHAAGNITLGTIATRIDEAAFNFMAKDHDRPPAPKDLVAHFAMHLVSAIGDMLEQDATGLRLKAIEDNLEHIRMETDFTAISAIQGALAKLEERTRAWRRALDKKSMVTLNPPHQARRLAHQH